jgi:hypothetical protein
LPRSSPAIGTRVADLFLLDRRFPTLLRDPFEWIAIHAVRNGWMALDRGTLTRGARGRPNSRAQVTISAERFATGASPGRRIPR